MMANTDRHAVSSNWRKYEKFLATIPNPENANVSPKKAEKISNTKKRRLRRKKNKANQQENVNVNGNGDGNATKSGGVQVHGKQKDSEDSDSDSHDDQHRRRVPSPNRFVAMDCEMVGVGYDGAEDMLARVSVVNRSGNVLLDKYVRPQQEVVNYRTHVSGIRPHNIRNAEHFDKVQKEVIKLLQGKILVGHAVRKDLDVLSIKHPTDNTRDTAHYRPLADMVANGRTPSLKKLSKFILGIDIQLGEHNSVEDATSAMQVYLKCCDKWEASLLRRRRQRKDDRARESMKTVATNIGSTV